MLHSHARYARVDSRVHRVGQDLQTATAIPARAVVQGVLILFNARGIIAQRSVARRGGARSNGALAQWRVRLVPGGGRRGGAVRGDRARRSEVCQATRVDYPSTLPGVC